MTDRAPNDRPPHPATLSAEALLADCDVQRTRRGGPGGQHRNKTETAIVITHRSTGVSGQASERRSQAANREVALFRLRLNLAIAIRSVDSDADPDEAQPNEEQPAPSAHLPSERWQSRIAGGKISVSENHNDFPTLLAESLDRIFANKFELGVAARELGVSTSQLVKFLKRCPEAWQHVQQRRVDHGLPRLK